MAADVGGWRLAEVDDDRKQVGGDQRVGSTRPRVAGWGCGAAGHREDGGRRIGWTAAGGYGRRRLAGKDDGDGRRPNPRRRRGSKTARRTRTGVAREEAGAEADGFGRNRTNRFLCVTSGIGG
jgi:hypothetical protein